MKKLFKYFAYKISNVSDEYKRAAKADDAFNFIWGFQAYLRTQYKWGDPPDSIEEIYEKWYELLNENYIHLDELYT